MAALDFPPVPTTDSEVTTGDITWKWNGYAWYATNQAGDVFLSKVTDDTAAGLITFEKGVSVTGGDSSVDTGIIEYTTDGLGLVAGGKRTVNVTNSSMYVVGEKKNLTRDELGISSQQTIENLASPSRAYRAYDATTTPVGNWWSQISLYYADNIH